MEAARNGRVAARLGGLVAVMLALSFAAVPFYDWFCRVTGYGGTTATAAASDSGVREETVTVRFDANTGAGLPWEFRPTTRTMEVRLGETALVFYEAYNPTDAVTAGTASFNVTPHSTGAFFAKIACFCFELQVLEPGERVEMPVSFFVDPDMLDDREAKDVRVITLSYTMHASAIPAERAADAGSATRLATAQGSRGPETAPAAVEN